jgi:uncharacterized membrane protein YgcG
MMGRMRRIAALISALIVVFVGTPAHAGVPGFPGQQVDRWDAVYTLQPDGSAHVRVEIDFNFGDTPGRGPYWSLVTRQQYDDNRDRLYTITDVTASSPSGAPAKVYLDQGRNELAVRVGDENIANVSGIQTYVVEYRVERVMNQITGEDLGGTGTDPVYEEFYWNAIGGEWQTPVSNISIEVRAPADVLEYQCFAGPQGVTTPCASAEETESGITFSHDVLGPREPFTVNVAYAPGVFETEPVLIESNDFKRAFSITPVTVGLFLLLLLLGGYRWVRALRTHARDEQFAGLTPGLAPAPGQIHGVTARDRNAPVTVQFEPPAGMRPGQLGTLIDEKADTHDVTASIVDFAVRGYMRIDDAGKTGSFLRKEQDYTLVKLRSADAAMVDYERTLFKALFKNRTEVKLSDLATTFSSDMASVQEQMYTNVTSLGWFRGNPKHARTAWAGSGILLLIVGAILTIWFANIGSMALIPVALIIVGVARLVTTNRAPARTAEGTRVLAQTQGFELYLETADGNQLRFEEGHDIFSQYLPYAIAFGVADKWAKKFEDLAKQGRDLPEPSWYGGYAMGTFWAHSGGFGQQMNQFAALADAAISAPTPGSSGGSGFSGGGGSSGGGGGGGGGGGW